MSDNGWQPIASAPRDGTKVDLFYPLGVGRVTDSYWIEPMQAWVIDVLIDNETGKETRGISPTHWRHLPPSPKPESNDQ